MTSAPTDPGVDSHVIFAIMNISHARCKLHASNRPSRATCASRAAVRAPYCPILFESESTDTESLVMLGPG